MSERSDIVAIFGMSFQPYQGRYLRVLNQLRALARTGFRVTLLCWDRECTQPQTEKVHDIHVYRLRIAAPVGQGPRVNAPNVLRFNRAAYRYLAEHPPSVIHCYNLDGIGATYLAARRLKARTVLDLCEPEYYALWKRRYRWLLKIVNGIEKSVARSADHVFVHNRFQVRKFTGYGIGHVTQVGSYPNCAMIPAKPAPPRGDRFVIGRLGTIYADTGIEEMLEAYRMLLERAESRDCARRYHLFLAGKVFDVYRSIFEALIEPFGDKITVHGTFDSAGMPELYRALDMSLVLARRTRWFRNITPTKLFDSMANGVPVLASDIGDVRDVIDEADWGIVVDERDPLSICNGIESIAETPGLRERMAAGALKLARERYTWEVYEPAFLERYASLVGSP